MIEYFIIVNNVQKGPFSKEDLLALSINQDTLIWHKGLDKWTRAKNIPDLAEVINFQPPPIPLDIIEDDVLNVKINSPVELNINKTSSISKEKFNDNLRKITKITFTEIGIIISFIILSLLISIISYSVYFETNRAPEVSMENMAQYKEAFKNLAQERYTKWLNDQQINHDFYRIEEDKLKDKYFGYYKYDSEITFDSLSEFFNINEARKEPVKWRAEEFATHFFIFSISILIVLRYIIKFIKWYNSSDNSVSESNAHSQNT